MATKYQDHIITVAIVTTVAKYHHKITTLMKFAAYTNIVSSNNNNKPLLDHKPKAQNKTQLKLKLKIFSKS